MIARVAEEAARDHLYLIVRRHYGRATVRFAVRAYAGPQRAIAAAEGRGDEPLDLVRAPSGAAALAAWRAENPPAKEPLPPEDRLRLLVAIYGSGRGGNAALGRAFGLTRERVRQIRRSVTPATLQRPGAQSHRDRTPRAS